MTNKFVVLFAVLVCLFAVTAAFAQIPEELTLSPVDETAAADVLGSWYFTSVMMDEEEVSMLGMGFAQVLDLKADNTAVLSAETEMETEENVAEPDTIYWDMNEDGSLNFYRNSFSEDGAFEKSTVVLDEAGKLIETPEDETSNSVNIFARELPVLRGEAEIKADAVFADFEGKWTLYAMITEGVRMKAASIGMENAYVEFTEEGSMHLFLDEENDEILALEADEDGILSAVDETGEVAIAVGLLEDNTVEVYMISTTEESTTETDFFFIPEGEVVEEPMSLMEVLIQAFSEVDFGEETEAATDETASTTEENSEIVSDLENAADAFVNTLFDELSNVLDSAEAETVEAE